MYRSQTLIDEASKILGYAYSKTYKIRDELLYKFMQNSVSNLQDLANLKIPVTSRIEIIANSDEQFRTRYMEVLNNQLDWHTNKLVYDYKVMRMYSFKDYLQVKKQFKYIENKFKNLLKYKQDLYK